MCSMNYDNIVISFCITVYNQYNLVKKCIESIIPYNGNDIEIIISDDGSTEDIKGLSNSFNDDRIKYFLNDPNLGHDLNILSSFARAKGRFAFLLTSRCQVIPESIPDLIQFINKYPNCSYITGNAIEEDGRCRYSYEKEIITQGYDAIHSLFYLYNHPAGSLYSLNKIRLQELRDFLKANALNKQSFSAHCLMRMQLAEAGDFGFVCRPMWKYIRPHNDDIAVNRAPGKLSVYDPYYLKQRCVYKLMWCKREVKQEHWDFVVINIFKKYLRGCTWEFYFDNSDSNLQNHYGYSKREYSLRKEKRDFIQTTIKCIRNIYGYEYYNQIKDSLRAVILNNTILGWEKIVAQKILKNSKLYHVLGKIYKSVMSKKL